MWLRCCVPHYLNSIHLVPKQKDFHLPCLYRYVSNLNTVLTTLCLFASLSACQALIFPFIDFKYFFCGYGKIVFQNESE